MGVRDESIRETTKSSLLRALQNENDSLRSQLLQVKQERDLLKENVQDLTCAVAHSAISVASVVPSSPTTVSPQTNSTKTTAQLEALRRRCRALASRLLCTVRDHQLSQVSEVHFLLRLQQEERRLLMESLESLLLVLCVEDAKTRSERQRRMYGESLHMGREVDQGDELPLPGDLQTGTICSLVMHVADAVHVHMADLKLERARTRLALEQVVEFCGEVQRALEGATRVVFGCTGRVEGLTVWNDASVARLCDVTMIHENPSTTAVRGALTHHRTTSAGDAPGAATCIDALDWSCDVLKACYNGISEVQRMITATCEDVLGPYQRLSCKNVDGGPSEPPAKDSTGLDGVLRGFQNDLLAIAGRGTRNQERLARRLSDEVCAHFKSSRMYEKRIHQLQSEHLHLLTAVTQSETDSASMSPVLSADLLPPQAVSAAVQPSLPRLTSPIGRGGVGVLPVHPSADLIELAGSPEPASPYRHPIFHETMATLRDATPERFKKRRAPTCTPPLLRGVQSMTPGHRYTVSPCRHSQSKAPHVPESETDEVSADRLVFSDHSSCSARSVSVSSTQSPSHPNRRGDQHCGGVCYSSPVHPTHDHSQECAIASSKCSTDRGHTSSPPKAGTKSGGQRSGLHLHWKGTSCCVDTSGPCVRSGGSSTREGKGVGTIFGSSLRGQTPPCTRHRGSSVSRPSGCARIDPSQCLGEELTATQKRSGRTPPRWRTIRDGCSLPLFSPPTC